MHSILFLLVLIVKFLTILKFFKKNLNSFIKPPKIGVKRGEKMTKKQAMNSFYYWSDQVTTPTGRENRKGVIMREAWAWAVDSGFYKKLPNDVIKADEILFKKFLNK